MEIIGFDGFGDRHERVRMTRAEERSRNGKQQEKHFGTGLEKDGQILFGRIRRQDESTSTEKKERKSTKGEGNYGEGENILTVLNSSRRRFNSIDFVY